MNYIRFAIDNPVKVAVGVLLVLLFGLISLVTIPIQLTPNVDQPIITIETRWTGRSPEEVEREIVEEQEDKLKGVTDLKKMVSTASQGEGKIELEFYVGTDMTRALQEVSDSLREVPEYPDDVDEPVITAADSASENAIAWVVLTSSDPDYDVQGFYDTADKRLKPILERVSGVGQINIYGGRERQVHIQIDPKRLAQRNITFNQLVGALRNENVNVSAGELRDGRRDVRIRTLGQYDDLDEVRKTIVTYDDGGPVRVSDLGDVVLTLEKQRSFVRSKSQIALAFQVTRETGSNVMSVMEELRSRIAYINEKVLPGIEPSLKLTQVYDETDYITDAVSLVQNNLVIGGTLAVLVLLLFLRTVRPTLVVALAIPISVIGTFVVMTAAGRNLNVISLAGLSFAVGMVVDAAIVVLENIDRHLSMGKRPRIAAYDAAHEVWGAILASALTTLAVFVPVLAIQEEAGQLFRDIAIAICAAVSLSLIVSITVIPSASARFLRKRHAEDPKSLLARWHGLFGLAKFFGWVNDTFANLIYKLTARNAAGMVLRAGIVAAFTVVSLGASYLLMPPSTYLPKGNRNLVFGIMFNPPGYNIDHNKFIAERIESQIRPYWEANSYEDIAKLDPPLHAFTQQPIENLPPIDNTFLVAFGGGMFMGASSQDKMNVAPLGDMITSSLWSIPGSFGFAQQMSLFGRGLGGSNSIDVEIAGSSLERVRAVAAQLQGRLMPLGQINPSPQNFNLAAPELQINIDRIRAQDLGVDTAALGLGVQALVDGAVIGDYRYEGDSIDLLLTRQPGLSIQPDQLKSVPMATGAPSGSDVAGTIPLSAIAEFKYADAPQEIKRIEQQRAITLSVIPPDTEPLEKVMDQIDSIVADMRSSGAIEGDMEIRLAGTADKLTQVRESLLGSWHGFTMKSIMSLGGSKMFLALLVTFLLMAALFESFLYPFVIMFTVPLATVGGFLGLRIVHEYVPDQQLDVLTMLGFVILIGIVVNNAILIVHQSLNFMRGIGEGENDIVQQMPPREAIRESVRTRIRPIFMTTATSVFGMLPLVLMPGSGSELYRGLGSVVVGGLVVSTVFTLVVVPLLFSLVLDLKQWIYETLKWELPETSTAPQVAVAAAGAAETAPASQGEAAAVPESSSV